MKTIRRRLGCLLLSAVLLLSMIPAAFAAPTPGMDNFKRVNTYTAGTFSDVPEGKWYTDSIKAAYEYGLALGSDGKFDRTSNMTVATAVTLAARLHAIYHTGSTAALVQGSPWYQVYVDYALTNGIIEAGQFANYDKTDATRAQCAVMLSKAIPADELPAINTVEDGAIPDVPADASYYEDIYALYRAGILTGNDDKGTFTPDATIDRTAFFTIATRLMDKSLRRDLTLKVELTGIQVKPTLWLFPGDTYQLSAAPVPSGAKLPAVTWSSADTKIATVSATGLVTMVAPGKTAVTAKTPGGLTASCIVNVMKREVTGVTLDQTSVSKYTGQSFQLMATVDPANASDQTLTWTSSNPRVATVSATGLVKCVTAGNATITAKASNGLNASCAVRVLENPSSEVEWIDGRKVEYQENKKQFVISFVLKDGNKIPMAAPGQIDIAIVNDDGDNVYEKTKYFTVNNFKKVGSTLACQITVPASEITGGLNKYGDLYFTVRNPGYYNFPEYSWSVYDLPMKETIVLLPTLPDIIHTYDYSNDIESSCRITEITYEVSGDTMYLYFSGEKIYDERGSGQSRACEVGWKLYDMDGYVVESGTMRSTGVAVGDRFRNEKEYVWDIEVGATYRLEILNSN